MMGVTPHPSTRPHGHGGDLSGFGPVEEPSPQPPPESRARAELTPDERTEAGDLLRRRDGASFPASVRRVDVFGDGLGTRTVVGPPANQGRRPDTREAPLASPAARRVAEVCHDMRQPLATIQYLVQGVLDDNQSSVIRGNLSGISAQVDYLTDLTEQLVGESAVVREPVEVRTLLQAVVSTVQGESVKDSVRVKLVRPKQIVISADEVALRRAIVNLAENAIRAAGPAGEVRISATARPGMAAICVEDSGPGLASAVSPRPSLGLLITEQVARTHGGRVEVATSDLLGGAAFRLLLPTQN
jgi:signal transduction histidine kinase